MHGLILDVVATLALGVSITPACVVFNDVDWCEKSQEAKAKMQRQQNWESNPRPQSFIERLTPRNPFPGLSVSVESNSACKSVAKPRMEHVKSSD